MYVFYPDIFCTLQWISILFALEVTALIVQYNPGIKRIGGFAFGLSVLETALIIAIRSFVTYAFVVHMILVPTTMMVVFRERNLLKVGKDWLLSYGATMLYYGLLQWLRIETGHQGILLSVISALGLYCCIWVVLRCCKRDMQFYQVLLKYKGVQVKGIGFLDTGNLLRDPITGKAVSLASRNFLKPILNIYTRPYGQVIFQTISQKGIIHTIEVEELQIITSVGKKIFQNVRIGVAEDDAFKETSYQLLLNNEHAGIRRGDRNAH